MRSVYIHIPFCKTICSYCDFCKFIYKYSWAKGYLKILKDEIINYYENDKVKSIYIGGGTPSSLTSENLEYLFKIISIFDKSDNCEITFECNVNDINEELLNILRDNDVNRLSIGVESFDKNNLKYLNRSHNKKDIFNKIDLCKKFNFNNINVDLIYALPTESFSVFKKDVLSILKLNVEHISTYSLIIEENTMLYNLNEKVIDETIDSKMYQYICKKLSKKGYNHYEVSNFSKIGYESIHNLTYWDNCEYYGFGLSACGYINNVRYENTRNFNKYMNRKYRFNELIVSTLEQMENEIIFGLRKLKGINVKEFYNKYNQNIEEVFKIDNMIKKKCLILKNNYLYIPEDKIYIMNEIINSIL